MKRAGLAGALIAFAIATTVQAQGVQAQAAPPTCTARGEVPGELAAWNAPVNQNAVGRADRTAQAVLPVGQAASLALLPTPQVKYPSRPEKPGGSVSYGGLVRFDVREAGTYRVALGSAAWIDVVGAGKAVASTAHGHGPACTGIRKMVDFPLSPGRYMLQISASGGPQTTVLVARLR